MRAIEFDEDTAMPARETIPAPVFPPLGRAIIAFAFLMFAEFFYGWAWNSVDVLRPFIREALGLTLTQVGSGYSAQGCRCAGRGHRHGPVG